VGGSRKDWVDAMDVNVICKDTKLPSNRYEVVFRTAQDGILILEHPSGKIIDANDYFVNLTGYSRTDILHKELWELGFLGDRDRSIRAFKELLTKNYIRYDNISLRHITGRLVPVEFVSNIYPIDNSLQIQCNVRDISDRVLAQEGLFQAQVQLVEMLFGAITCIGQLVEARDPYTSGHQTRVAKLAVAIADHLKLSSDEIICLRVAAKGCR
jgi:PAS domain S-box-containing protein